MFKILVFLTFFLPLSLFAQFSIKGTFTPADEYKWIILYKVTPTTSIYVDNAEVDQEGNFEFVMDSASIKGVYRIVYAMPQEEFNFDIIYNAKENVEFSFSDEKGVEFINSSENKLLTSFTKSMMMINQTINSYYSQGNQDKEKFKEIFSTMREAQASFEEASKGTIASHFIKANANYIPSEYENLSTYAKNLRNGYLTNVDFNSPILQSSEFLVQRMLGYVFGMNSNPDDLDVFKSSVDDIYNAIETTEKQYQKTLLKILWNQFADIENETMANYIASEYLSPIAEELNDTELAIELMIYKNTSVGVQAPDFNLGILNEGDEKELTKLSEIDTHQRYVIFFWSSSCGHCLEELPELKKYILSMKEGDTKVIAVGLEEAPYNWNNEIIYYSDFIHVYGEGKWDNPIGDTYGVKATPTYFVLDRDKKIIAKPYDCKALTEYLDNNKIKIEEPFEKEKEEEKIVKKKED